MGLLLRGIKREDVSRGQVASKPSTVKTYKVELCLALSQLPQRESCLISQLQCSQFQFELTVYVIVNADDIACLSAVQKFEAEVYALTKEEGGRHSPFTTNYAPQFFFRTADVVGKSSFHASMRASSVRAHALF